MPPWQYTRGLHAIGDGVFTWLQPTGTWGWSNAGLVVDGHATLLVDTLFDLRNTREMLDAMRHAVPASRALGSVVNTHANGDHCWGNELVGDAEIISSLAAAEEMKELSPAKMATLMKLARLATRMGPVAATLGGVFEGVGLGLLGRVMKAGPYVSSIFGDFDFSGITLTLPTRTFSGQLDLKVGTKDVTLLEVGPAHTRGDTLVYLPADRTVFTGDILFIGGHPIVWEGPISNWIRACDRILDLDVDIIVPGHGPPTNKEGVRRVKLYLTYVWDEAKKRHAAGLSADEAARDIQMDQWAGWNDGERIVVNVMTAYRELNGDTSHPDVVGAFGKMAAHWARAQRSDG